MCHFLGNPIFRNNIYTKHRGICKQIWKIALFYRKILKDCTLLHEDFKDCTLSQRYFKDCTLLQRDFKDCTLF